LLTGLGRGLTGAALLLWLSGCQILFGDFSIEESAPIADPEPLGASCEPNTFRCTGEHLETCAPDRHSWERVESCPSAGACDPTAAACRACTTGEWACNGPTPQRCDAGTWIPSAACASAALCRVSTDRSVAGCSAPVCKPPGGHECRGALLLRCSEGQDRVVLADRCTSSETCDAAHADAQAAALGWGTCRESMPEPCEGDGSCTAPACAVPGEVRCVSEVLTLLEACGNARRWMPRGSGPCESQALCSAEAARCLAPACELYERRCFGQVYQICSSDLTRWVDDVTCAANEACTLTGCAPRACENDAFRCNGPSRERCVDNRWLPVHRCATAALCNDAGACDEPICGGELGDYRCQGESLEQCTRGRDGWETRPCPGGCVIDQGVPICNDVQMP
jgi:hypothetical protein